MQDELSTARDAMDCLATMTYQQVADRFGVSRGKVYSWALALGRRKHESQIRQRKREREAERRAFIEAVMNSSQTADVLDFLDELPDQSVNLHATSIPYNVGKPYGGCGSAMDRKAHHFYVGWMLQVFSEIARTLADGGVAFLNMGATKDDQGLLRPLDTVFFEYLVQMGLVFQNRVVWEVPHGLTPARRLSNRYEVVLIFSKGQIDHFNANAARVPQKNPGKRAYKGPNKGCLSGHPLGAWPSDVWRDIGNVGASHPEKTGHPAQFPQSLVRRAIRLYTYPGDLVVDVFDGSGTTTATAKSEGRSYLGCDLFYHDVRQHRLEATGMVSMSELPGVSVESLAVWQAEAVRRSYIAPESPETVRQTVLEWA